MPLLYERNEIMDTKSLSTTHNFELDDGTVVQMTLKYFALYQLRAKNKAAYDKYNRIMMKGPQEELENITILYTAYLCANLDSIETCMSETEFMQRVPDDREYLGTVLTALINSKKKK